jgi:transcriptional regulator of arginine metabolism
MFSKKLRQGKIISIVQERAVPSQEELLSFLAAAGIRVTQATLSRDLRELNLVKIRGIYRRSADWNEPSDRDALRRALKQFVLQSGVSGNMLMIRTAPGNAHAVGVVLDSARWPEVLGTVAGDDTVFALLKSARLARKVMKRIEEHLS